MAPSKCPCGPMPLNIHPSARVEAALRWTMRTGRPAASTCLTPRPSRPRAAHATLPCPSRIELLPWACACLKL